MLLPDVIYLAFLLHRCCNATVCQFDDLPFMHRCSSAGIMIPVAQMLQCRIITGLFLVLGWIAITHLIGVVGYISQYFCLMWDCAL